MALGNEEDIRLAACLVGFDVESRVGFLVDQDVGIGRADGVAVEAVLALGNFVFLGVEDRLIVVGPALRSPLVWRDR